MQGWLSLRNQSEQRTSMSAQEWRLHFIFNRGGKVEKIIYFHDLFVFVCLAQQTSTRGQRSSNE